MNSHSYERRRGQLEDYFDRTAVEAWARLTSTAPVGRIRATVRAGREEMRDRLLSWLPADLEGMRVLDAGCGTGALAVEAARRGAEVVAIDLSATLVGLAHERSAALGETRIDYRVGDMLDPALGRFDFVVAMDSLIHYEAPDMVRMVAGLAARAERGLLFTFAPRTWSLALMHRVGQLFPRGDRSPAIEPIEAGRLGSLLRGEPRLEQWQIGRGHRVATGFYISEALEMSARSAA